MSTSASSLQDVASVDDFLNVAATETVPLFEQLEFEFLLEYDVFDPASGGRTRVYQPPDIFCGFLPGLVLTFLVAIIAILAFIVSIITIIGPLVVLYAWYAYDEFILGAVWGHVARDLSQQGLLLAVSPMDELDL